MAQNFAYGILCLCAKNWRWVLFINILFFSLCNQDTHFSYIDGAHFYVMHYHDQFN